MIVLVTRDGIACRPLRVPAKSPDTSLAVAIVATSPNWPARIARDVARVHPTGIEVRHA